MVVGDHVCNKEASKQLRYGEVDEPSLVVGQIVVLDGDQYPVNCQSRLLNASPLPVDLLP